MPVKKPRAKGKKKKPEALSRDKPSVAKRPKRRPAKSSGLALIPQFDVATIPITRIKPAPYNPRKDLEPGSPEWRKIEASLDGFGLVEPLVWNKKTKHLVSGHQRLKILRDKGATEIPVAVVNIPPAVEKRLVIAMNRVAGDWDGVALANMLRELQAEDVSSGEFLEMGFTDPETDRFLAQYALGVAGDQEREVSFATKETYLVIVETLNDAAQRELIARLTKDGYQCRTG